MSALALVALSGLFVWAAWARYAMLYTSAFPIGVDGYFYPIQLRSLLDTGALYYPSSPLSIWLMAPLAWLTDPITGAKLGAAIGGAAIVFPIYVLGRRIGSARSAGMVAAVLVASSAESFYLSAEFVKSGLGLTVAMAYLCALAWTLDAHTTSVANAERTRAGRWSLTLLALLATALAHKLAFAFALLCSATPLVIAWRAQARAIHPRTVVIAAALAIAMITAAIVWPTRFLSWRDLALMTHLFDGAWLPSLPALSVPQSGTLHFQHEPLLACMLAVPVLIAWWRRRADLSTCDQAFSYGSAVFAVVIAVPVLNVSDPEGLGFRLRLVCFIPLALCAAWITGQLVARISTRYRLLVLIPFLLAFLYQRPTGVGEGVVTTHPSMQAAVRTVRGLVPENDVIVVPERHLVFMTAWHTDRSVRLRPDTVPVERRWRLVPMAYMNDELSRAIRRARTEKPATLPPIRRLHPEHENGLVLMQEPTWNWLVTNLSPASRRFYRRWPTL